VRKKVAALAGLVVLGGVATTGCLNKTTEPWNDAPISRKDDSAAVVYSMPDGFGNVASKCDGYGHRIFTLYHADSSYGGVSVVDDPACRR
jgi:hypothetical protein